MSKFTKRITKAQHDNIKRVLRADPPEGEVSLVSYHTGKACYCAIGTLAKSVGISDEVLIHNGFDAIHQSAALAETFGLVEGNAEVFWRANDSVRGPAPEARAVAVIAATALLVEA